MDTSVCPTCFMELPNSGVCDECGKPETASDESTATASVLLGETFNEAATYAYARKLLDSLGLAHVELAWVNTTRRLGRTLRRREDNVPVRIELSRKMFKLMSSDARTNTITHEAAHALTPGHGHDAVWAKAHRLLGGDGLRCTDLDESTKNAAYKWKGTCPNGHVAYRAQKSARMFRVSCGECSPVWSEALRLTWVARW